MLKKATLSDSRMIWEWRNDPITRQMSFDSHVVPWEIHEKWFEQSLINPNRHIYVFYLENIPVAMIRLDIDNEEAEIGINVDPSKRGKGYGTAAIKECIKTAANLGVRRLIAKVKSNNKPSIHAFIKAGFKIKEENNYIVMEFELTNSI